MAFGSRNGRGQGAPGEFAHRHLLSLRIPRTSGPGSKKGLWEKAWLVLLVAFLGFILLTFSRHGQTYDEGVQDTYGGMILRYLGSFGSDRSAVTFSDLWMYGGVFEMAASKITRVFGPWGGMEARHLFNALFGALAGVLLYRTGRRLGGPRLGFSMALCLWILPYWVGHSFNNSKDVPYAVGVLAVFCALTNLVLESPRASRLRFLELGLALGLAMGVRVAGLSLLLLFVLPAFAGLLVHAWVRSGREERVGRIAELSIGTVLAVVLAWGIMVIPWPWMHANPITRPFELLGLVGRFVHEGVVLYRGAFISDLHLPWHYIPGQMLVRIPLVLQGFLLAGLLFSAWAVWKGRVGAKTLWVAFLWSAGFLVPLLFFAIRKPVLYDGMRHALFLLPFVAAVAGVGLSALLGVVEAWWREGRRLRAALAGLVVALPVAGMAGEIVYLSPHEYVFFNAWTGGLKGAYGKYHMDYWCNGYREALGILERESRNLPRSEKPWRIHAFGSLGALEHDAPPGFQVVADNVDLRPGDFIVYSTFSPSEIEHGGVWALPREGEWSTTRHGVPINRVFRLSTNLSLSVAVPPARW